MASTLPRGGQSARQGSATLATLESWVDRLARIGFWLLIAVLAYGLIAGAILAILWPSSSLVRAPDFPVPLLVPLGFVLVLGLSLPSLGIGLLNCLRGRWAAGIGRLLPFCGTLFVLFATEAGAHLLSPCDSGWWGQTDWLPWLCEPYIDAALNQGYSITE